MKESEVKKAVEAARGYLNHNHGLGYFELKNLCRAIIALDEDCIDDDDIEEGWELASERVRSPKVDKLDDTVARVLSDEEVAQRETGYYTDAPWPPWDSIQIWHKEPSFLQRAGRWFGRLIGARP